MKTLSPALLLSVIILGSGPFSHPAHAWQDFLGEPLPSGAAMRLGSTKPAGELPADYPLPSSLRVVCLSDDGKLAATAGEPSDPTSEPRLIHIWETQTGKPLQKLEGHTLSVRSMAFSPDAKYLVSTSESSLGIGQTRIWEVSTGKTLHVLPVGGKSVQTSLREVSLAVPSQSQVLTFRYDNGQESQRSPRLKFPVTISPSGNRVLSIASQRDPRLWVMETRTGKELVRLDDIRTPAPDATLVISPDGRLLAASDGGNQILIWETATGQLIHTLKGHEKKVSAIALSPQGFHLISASYDKTVRVWELATGQQTAIFEGHTGPITNLAVSRNGSQILTGSIDRTALVWNLQPGLKSLLAAQAPNEQGQETIWQELSLTQPTKSWHAIGMISRHRATLLPYLKQEVHTLLGPTQKARIEQLLADLGNPDYILRHRATSELKKLRSIAQARLMKEMQETKSAEVRYRLRRILSDGKDTPRFSPGDIRRMVRIVQAMELINTRESKEILQMIADDFPLEEVAKEATESLQRLNAG